MWRHLLLRCLLVFERPQVFPGRCSIPYTAILPAGVSDFFEILLNGSNCVRPRNSNSATARLHDFTKITNRLVDLGRIPMVYRKLAPWLPEPIIDFVKYRFEKPYLQLQSPLPISYCKAIRIGMSALPDFRGRNAFPITDQRTGADRRLVKRIPKDT